MFEILKLFIKYLEASPQIRGAEIDSLSFSRALRSYYSIAHFIFSSPVYLGDSLHMYSSSSKQSLFFFIRLLEIQ